MNSLDLSSAVLHSDAEWGMSVREGMKVETELASGTGMV